MVRVIRLIGMGLFVAYYLVWVEHAVFPTIISIFSIVVGATVFHEISHCAVARIWTNDCSIDWELGMKPGTANFGSPLDVPPSKFKYIGAASLIFSLIGMILAIFLVIRGWAASSYIVIIVIGISSGLLASMSPSDEFAIRHPAAFRKYAAEHDDFDLEKVENYLE